MKQNPALLSFVAFSVWGVAIPGLAAEPSVTVLLRFQDAPLPKVKEGKKEPDKGSYRSSLSAAAFAAKGKTLFVAGDETVCEEPSIEVLTRQTDGSFDDHKTETLSKFIGDLPDMTEDKGRIGEIDIEGLAIADGYLWFVGSHSCNRKQPKNKDDENEALEKLATVEEGANRFLLGRIPLVENDQAGASLAKKDGTRKAGRLVGEAKHWTLLDELEADKHLGPFLQKFSSDGHKVRLPGKDNGFDIEGLAVKGNRVFLGLRGPVLRGWACILELKVEDKGNDGDFKLVAFDGENSEAPKYRKHFVQLEGLGIRELAVDGDDLWIMSGPTMGLDGPSRLLRWPKAFEIMGHGDTLTRTLGDSHSIDLPVSTGHPEGMALVPSSNSQKRRMMVVYDGPLGCRLDGETNVKADEFNIQGP